ncbi:hypothetical protein HMPREF0645_0178 [Hallella bergensis DSM 17361]|uniref:Uncharacterized protein n=1 Tax=Hallella bergensis DSM 17361 TaxID=585502 RepID=D1PT93_9BACT|nr:hypothetical protein HMPREF0645_0178 [Hallella bergensis DSM 17361]
MLVAMMPKKDGAFLSGCPENYDRKIIIIFYDFGRDVCSNLTFEGTIRQTFTTADHHQMTSGIFLWIMVNRSA